MALNVERRIWSSESDNVNEFLRYYFLKHPQRKVYSIGNSQFLKMQKLGFFCSVRCPGNIILRSYDFAKILREKGIIVISGFHSPMEQECLKILLHGKQPIIICPARNIENMRIPKDWYKPLEEKRLLILSTFNEKQNRMTAQTAKVRNEFVALLSDKVFVGYAAPNSKTYQFCNNLIKKGKPIYTLNCPENIELINSGADVVNPDRFEI